MFQNARVQRLFDKITFRNVIDNLQFVVPETHVQIWVEMCDASVEESTIIAVI